MQISQSSSVIVEMMVQVQIVNLPNNIQRLSCRSKEQTAVNQRWSYTQSGNDGYRITVSKRLLSLSKEENLSQAALIRKYGDQYN